MDVSNYVSMVNTEFLLLTTELTTITLEREKEGMIVQVTFGVEVQNQQMGLKGS